MSFPLEAEINTYNSQLSSIMEHAGKFVLIKGDDVIDFYDAYEDALKEGYKAYEDGVFLVKRVAPAEQVSFFTRSLSFQCPA